MVVRRLIGAGTLGNVHLRSMGGDPDHLVAVREYLPMGLAIRGRDGLLQPQSSVAHAGFRSGLDRFVERARPNLRPVDAGTLRTVLANTRRTPPAARAAAQRISQARKALSGNRLAGPAAAAGVAAVLVTVLVWRGGEDDGPPEQPTTVSVQPDATESAAVDEPALAHPFTAATEPPGALVAFEADMRLAGPGPAMVVVPAGSFRMGCVSGNACTPQERPVRTVTFAEPFSISKYEVTFDEFDAFARATDRPIPDDSGWGRGRRPVVNVSWDDAKAYAEWLAAETGRRYRLPTEAEWEYAARAQTETPFAWGEGAVDKANCANCGRSPSRTLPVGSYTANAWGLHDMHGNVWEWVQDCWNDSYEGAPPTGKASTRGDCGRRVVRGGSWFNEAMFARSASRLRGDPTMYGSIAGFRVAARDE